MGTGIEDLAGLVRDLSIAVNAPQDRGQEPLRSTCSHPGSLQEAIQMLNISTNTVISQVQSIKSLADEKISFGNLPITEICSLHRGLKKLTEITLNLQSTIEALNEVTENSVITHLKSLGSQSAPVAFSIFSHLDEKIKEIIRKGFKNTWDGNVLWKIAEECYKQVTSPSGNLNPDDYLVPREEARLQRLCDPDFESEAYYELEDCLDLHEGYAASFSKQLERMNEASRKERQSWTDFWFRVLNNAPAGPTLFYPPLSPNLESLSLDTVPTYLFRAFDRDSSGRNNVAVIASAASILESHGDSRTDILTLETERATKLLYMHLKDPKFDVGQPDNLVSWTSSLIFAIQYSVYRLRVGKCSPSQIHICAVDTRDFSRGQFAQDVSLINAYHVTAKQMGGPIPGFFDFRLKWEDYYNGEYLSQGAVNHIDRSCVFSLEYLRNAGFFKLYPEFEDNKQWTKRVKQLRQKWSVEHVTTDREIELALQVGRRCFPRFEPCDIASLLLSFKNRKCKSRNPTDNFNYLNRQRPEWADKPDEVRRYWMATEAVNSYNKVSQSRSSHSSLQHHKTLREIFG